MNLVLLTFDIIPMLLQVSLYDSSIDSSSNDWDGSCDPSDAVSLTDALENVSVFMGRYYVHISKQ